MEDLPESHPAGGDGRLRGVCSSTAITHTHTFVSCACCGSINRIHTACVNALLDLLALILSQYVHVLIMYFIIMRANIWRLRLVSLCSVSTDGGSTD